MVSGTSSCLCFSPEATLGELEFKKKNGGGQENSERGKESHCRLTQSKHVIRGDLEGPAVLMFCLSKSAVTLLVPLRIFSQVIKMLSGVGWGAQFVNDWRLAAMLG